MPENAARPADEELERLRTELAAAKQQLVEAHQMASIGRLLAGIVHEINTPIGSIFSNNEVMLRSLEGLKRVLAEEEPARIRKARNVIETLHSLAAVDKIACERISSVIRGLKTFARVDDSELRKVDLNEHLRNTLKLTQAEFRRRVTVATDFDELPEVECYPQMLNQVFLNLLVNAGQAIQGEGRIRVRTRKEGDTVRVSISDTGHGMTAEQKNKLFKSGFTTKAEGVGTGLGLSISREIVVEKHRGRIEFESEPGAGTTFHVIIPVRHAREAAG